MSIALGVGIQPKTTSDPHYRRRETHISNNLRTLSIWKGIWFQFKITQYYTVYIIIFVYFWSTQTIILYVDRENRKKKIGKAQRPNSTWYSFGRHRQEYSPAWCPYEWSCIYCVDTADPLAPAIIINFKKYY